jgi:hypothetical protein
MNINTVITTSTANSIILTKKSIILNSVAQAVNLSINTLIFSSDKLSVPHIKLSTILKSKVEILKIQIIQLIIHEASEIINHISKKFQTILHQLFLVILTDLLKFSLENSS